MQYKIMGEPMPVVECKLESGETMRTERGSMMWMSSNMEMKTNTGGGGLGKMFGKALMGESVFENQFTPQGGPGMVTFGSSFVGSIKAFDLRGGRTIVCQKSAFLASEMSVEMSVFFQKKIGAALFGGEGFIMQKMTGEGTVFVEIDGTAIEYELKEGESMLLDTGCLAMMDGTCQMDIESVKGVKNLLFGGEGAFHTRVTGPGKILVQTMTLSSFAGKLSPFFKSKSD